MSWYATERFGVGQYQDTGYWLKFHIGRTTKVCAMEYYWKEIQSVWSYMAFKGDLLNKIEYRFYVTRAEVQSVGWSLTEELLFPALCMAPYASCKCQSNFHCKSDQFLLPHWELGDLEPQAVVSLESWNHSTVLSSVKMFQERRSVKQLEKRKI